MTSAGVHRPTAYARSSAEKTKQESKVAAEAHPTDLVANRKPVVYKPLFHCTEPGKERIVDEIIVPPAGVTLVPTEGDSIDESPVREKRQALARSS